MKKQFIIISTFALMLLASIGFGERSSSEDLEQSEPPSWCPPDTSLKLGWSNMPIAEWLKDPEGEPLFVECPYINQMPNMHCCIPITVD